MPAPVVPTLDDFEGRHAFRAVDLPDLRLELVRQWSPGGAFAQAARLARPDSGLASLQGFDAGSLLAAELFWVSEQTCETIRAAQMSYPPDTVLDETFLPSRDGLCVFASPFVGMDADDNAWALRVDAIGWGPVFLRRRAGGPLHEAVAITTYGWVSEARRLVTLGRADWRFGRRLDSQTFDDDALGPTQLASVIEDRRILATLASLLGNDGLTERTVDEASRPVRRRSIRAGIDPDCVRVHTVRLRREGHVAASAGGDWFQHRFVVRGHWRQARVGPAVRVDAHGNRVRIPASERATRPVWVHAHIKGPEGAVLLDPGNKVHRL